nr:helix-turn-helix domain-containing protein [uncultured Carboxylicivirga sp.]
MDEQQDFNAETLKNLEQLNQKVTELINVQRKAVSGYDFINANELADLLGESIKTVYSRVHNRQIPFYKPGGKILLFKLDEIQDWVKSGRRSSIDEIKQNV